MKQSFYKENNIIFLEYDMPITLNTINSVHFTDRKIDIIACLLGGKAYNEAN